MANSVNGQAAITLDSHRRLAGCGADWFRNVLGAGGGQVLRADLVIDTTGDFTVDDPTVSITPANTATTDGTKHRIYVVGWQMLMSAASTVTVKSAANTLVTYNFAANGGLSAPIQSDAFLLATNAGEKLVVNFGTPSPAVTFTVYYVIAAEFKPLVGR